MILSEKVKKNWKNRGFSFGIWEDEPGQEWNDFIHSEDELLWLLRGEIEVSFNGEKIRPQIGEEVLIPAKTPHSVKNTGSEPNKWFYGYRLTKTG